MTQGYTKIRWQEPKRIKITQDPWAFLRDLKNRMQAETLFFVAFSFIVGGVI